MREYINFKKFFKVQIYYIEILNNNSKKRDIKHQINEEQIN